MSSSTNRPTHTSRAQLDLVQEAVAEAVYLASGYDISELKHCHVQISSNYRNSGDMKTNAAAALFLMHTARNKKEVSSLSDPTEKLEEGDHSRACFEKKEQSDRVMEVVTTSRYGLKAPRRYESGKMLAPMCVCLVN
jgi:hypothetical protein